jgi:hypothetical protein
MVSCSGEGISPESGETVSPDHGCDFSSVAEENEFWKDWKLKHANDSGLLEPFYWERDVGWWRPINQRLIKISRASGTFVFVVRINIDNGILDVAALAENRGWQLVKWEIRKGVHESYVKGVQVDALKRLASKNVCVDASDLVFDADSVYVFVRHNGQCSRYAIYHPRFDSGGATQRDPVFAAVESLLRDIGMAPPRRN